ncbi:unnamed protein product [Adineta ricciae]|uniref:Uncharacterized protein n=1 Tax=Adineta ricciae TaxID=249248 RepID=A0A815DKS4_ADIRI|nr:unnamed protein product [Adineta ricciae]CAF1294974.1 unnamed protein product [Adineta ricciae]
MSKVCLTNLPCEIIYLIFEYLHKEHIVYSFFELTNDFSLFVEHFLSGKFQLAKANDNRIFQYGLSIFLPTIGLNLSYLSIGPHYRLSTSIQAIKTFCLYLKVLHVHCHSEEDDVRLYISQFLHSQLISLIFRFNNEIIGEQISYRLLEKSYEKQFQRISIPSSCLTLHLSSMNQLALLKRYSQSSYLPDGSYMIESMSSEGWIVDGKDDLCIVPKRLPRENLFFVKQSYLEYEFSNESTGSLFSVLKCSDNEEYWIPSSILSIHRKQSNQLCRRFTLEKFDDHQQYYIRPCYSGAKRLQVLGKRIVVSLCNNEKTIDHRFRFHRIA